MTRIEIGNRIEGAVDLEQDEVHVAELVIPAAQMRALATTVKEMVAAPGVAKALYPRWVSVEMLGTTAFGGIASGDDLHLRSASATGDNWATVETTGFLDQVTQPKRVTYVRTITGKENMSLVLHSGGAITGGSDCLVKVGYTVEAAE